MTFLSLKSLFVPVVLLASGAAMAADAAATAGRSRIVAREDFDVSVKFTPPDILQRRFWNMLNFHGTKAAEGQAAITNEPMVREAAVRYDLPDLRAAGDDPLAVNVDKLRPLKPDPRVPFVIASNAGRPPFRCLDDFRADKKSYEKWKQGHPNFLGFWTGIEWDNEYIGPLNDVRGAVEECRKKGPSETAVSRMQAVLARATIDRDHALEGLHDCYTALRRYYFDDPDKMLFLRAGWCFDHYALDWGAGMAILETTNSGNYRHQVSLFHIRGAARQYGKAWEWYIALGYNGEKDEKGRIQYSDPGYLTPYGPVDCGTWTYQAGPGCGMSVSLNRRDMYLAYLSGASTVQHECWPNAYCQHKGGNPNEWELSPHGKAMKEWYAFTQRHPDRGVSYAPVALLTPFNQGMPQGGGSPWSRFPPERPDTMIDGFMVTIVPNSQDLPKGKEGGLSNSRYGDIYDVLAANPTSGPVALAALTPYKVAILLGKQNVDAPLAERLMEYVRQGGTFVVNARQVTKYLPTEFLGAKPTGKILAVVGDVKNLLGGDAVALAEPYDYEQMDLSGAQPMWKDGQGGVLASVHEYGRGRVVLTTVDYLMPRQQANIAGTTTKMPLIELLLGQIVREVLPVEVQGDVEYGLSRVAGGWWLYLINNRGVTKFTKTPDELNPAETVRVTVDMRALPVAGVRELREDKDIAVLPGRNAFTIEVGPGDIRIVKIAAH